MVFDRRDASEVTFGAAREIEML